MGVLCTCLPTCGMLPACGMRRGGSGRLINARMPHSSCCPPSKQADKLPAWRSTLTFRALFLGLLLGAAFSIISLKLGLTTGGEGRCGGTGRHASHYQPERPGSSAPTAATLPSWPPRSHPLAQHRGRPAGLLLPGRHQPHAGPPAPRLGRAADDGAGRSVGCCWAVPAVMCACLAAPVPF